MARFVNPFTDFGFKKLFGEEANKDLLMDFLNSLLPQKHQIKELRFKKNERLGATGIDRKAIFDIFCESFEGEQFIVELQKAKQNYFIDRSIYYASFPIQQQAPRGEWDYHLKPVYCVGILDFKFDESSKNEHKYMHRVMLTEQETQEVFFEKLCFIYLEMPKFQKDIATLKDRKDQWLYFIKNLNDLQNIPQLFSKDIAFQKAFNEAEIAKFNRKEQNQYEKSLKYYRDLKNVTDTAFFEGKEEGFGEGVNEGIEIGKEQGIEIGKEAQNYENAKKMKALQADIDFISQVTGLSISEIQKL
jgi:predicted transposase/invertase (TIGR01784 family)